MDPLSIIAGTTGTAAFALHAAHRLYEFVNNIVDAPKEVAVIAREAEALSKILNSLDQWLDMGVIKEDAAGSLSDSLNICVITMSQLQTTLQPYTKLIGHSTLKWRSLGWAFKRNDVRELRERLQHGKSTLNISLSIINTYATASGNQHLSHQIESGNEALRNDFRTLQETIVKRKDIKITNASIDATNQGSMFNGTDSGLLLRRYIEDLPPADHPWSGASDISDILSIETFSLYDAASRPPTPTESPTKRDRSPMKLPSFMSPLHRAVADDNIRRVMELLDAGANVNDPGEARQTPLHICARYNNKVMAEVLVMKGADLTTEDEEDKTPLRRALEKAHEEVACLLLAGGGQVEVLADFISGIMYDDPNTDNLRDKFLEHLRLGPKAQEVSISRLYEMMGMEAEDGSDETDGEDENGQQGSEEKLIDFDEDDTLQGSLKNELTQQVLSTLVIQHQHNPRAAAGPLLNSNVFQIEDNLLEFEDEEDLRTARGLALIKTLKLSENNDEAGDLHNAREDSGIGLELPKSQGLVLGESYTANADTVGFPKPLKRAFSWE